ncbi:DUF881 domain-containing protein [Actinomycetaceae bacterium TAE3-ERU4]|nr:DUF881 domain-containing protein [Actinomycetaceae bacterium TAE3-ERU4]
MMENEKLEIEEKEELAYTPSPTTQTEVEDESSSPTPTKMTRVLSRLGDLIHAPVTLTHLVVALLLLVFGFSFAGQFQANKAASLDRLSQSDMITLLDELRSRNGKLTSEENELQSQLRQLQSATSSKEEAQQAAEARAKNIQIMAGEIPVSGPGVSVTVTDPKRTVTVLAIVDLLGELRNAGIEAADLSGTRVVASTYISKRGDDIYVDGNKISPPYRITALGDPHTLSVALGIPGGAVSFLKTFGAEVTISESPNLTIDSIHQVSAPKWAKPSE